jgi:glucose 1-dehydrogenase
LQGKTAVVTGGTSGIGRAIAVRFAAEGANVVIGDVTPVPVEGGESAHDEIAAAGGSTHFVKTDVTRWADWDALVGAAVERYGRLDVMINNAAVFSPTALLDTSEESWDRMMDVNVKGTFLGCKRAVQQMMTQEIKAETRGRVINLTSQLGVRAGPSNIAYGTGKAAIAYMTKQIALDYAKQHIVCNAIAPGKIITGKSGPAISEEAMTYSYENTPMPRLGVPADVANAAVFLASDEATFMTGAIIMVDGGWTTK